MITDLDIILSEGEGYTVEFKESADKDLPTEVCAFANASGGKVYIGIHDKGYVVGTDTSNTARSRIQDTINKIEPQLSVGIDVFDNIVVLTVPEGTHKPYSCPTGFYLRSGPNSQKLDRDSLKGTFKNPFRRIPAQLPPYCVKPPQRTTSTFRRFSLYDETCTRNAHEKVFGSPLIDFFQSEGRVRYDEIVRSDLPIAEKFDEGAYRKFIRLAGISEVLDRSAILKNLKCAADVGGELCFTNAGALFFRKNDEDVEFRHAGLVCALYKGIDKVYILDAKELNGDIISKVDDAMVFLKKHLRMSYKIVSVRRENILELPEDALREAVVNAVCHRDYFEKGARAMVEIFDDRVDIVSPGSVCKGVTPETFGTISITRNSIIANMLHRSGYIEQMGTGIKRMKIAAEEANVAAPEFSFSDFFKVTFKRLPSGQLSVTATDKQAKTSDRKTKTSDIRAKTSDRKAKTSDKQSATNRPPIGRYRPLSAAVADRKAAIISFLKENGQAQTADFVKLIGLSEGRVRDLLREMANEGTIEKISDKRYTYYILKKILDTPI